jgi:hypothetical protein
MTYQGLIGIAGEMRCSLVGHPVQGWDGLSGGSAGTHAGAQIGDGASSKPIPYVPARANIHHIGKSLTAQALTGGDAECPLVGRNGGENRLGMWHGALQLP